MSHRTKIISLVILILLCVGVVGFQLYGEYTRQVQRGAFIHYEPTVVSGLKITLPAGGDWVRAPLTGTDAQGELHLSSKQYGEITVRWASVEENQLVTFFCGPMAVGMMAHLADTVDGTVSVSTAHIDHNEVVNHLYYRQYATAIVSSPPQENRADLGLWLCPQTHRLYTLWFYGPEAAVPFMQQKVLASIRCHDTEVTASPPPPIVPVPLYGWAEVNYSHGLHVFSSPSGQLMVYAHTIPYAGEATLSTRESTAIMTALMEMYHVPLGAMTPSAKTIAGHAVLEATGSVMTTYGPSPVRALLWHCNQTNRLCFLLVVPDAPIDEFLQAVHCH